MPGEWPDKLHNFLKTNIQLLQEWHFNTIPEFENIYWILYQNMNQMAHPVFIGEDGIEIPDKLFLKEEFRVLGFLWDISEYPLNKFIITYNYSKPYESISTLKKGKKATEPGGRHESGVLLEGARPGRESR